MVKGKKHKNTPNVPKFVGYSEADHRLCDFVMDGGGTTRKWSRVTCGNCLKIGNRKAAR